MEGLLCKQQILQPLLMDLNNTYIEIDFDVSPTEKNEDIKIKMTVKNIEIIQNVLSNIHSHAFELKSVSNGRFNEDFDLIDDMKFYLSTSNFSFPKMYYGD